MKRTIAIYLGFNNSNSATAQITVPFKVSRIHCKGLSYNGGTNPVAGAAQYGVISSDLVDNQPLGIFYNDVTYSFASNKDVELTLYTPRTINGTYTFYLTNDQGNPYTPLNNGLDLVILLLEFNEFNEI